MDAEKKALIKEAVKRLKGHEEREYKGSPLSSVPLQIPKTRCLSKKYQS